MLRNLSTIWTRHKFPPNGESQDFSESQRTVQIHYLCMLKNTDSRHEKHKCSIAHRLRLPVLRPDSTKRQSYLVDLDNLKKNSVLSDQYFKQCIYIIHAK